MALDTKINILIVDDYKTMLRIIRNLLKQLGFENVEEAPDGGEAFAKLQAGNFRLVISDWNMEPVTGLQLLQMVRADAKLKAVPFIMVTAESKAENIAMAKQAGVSNYIVKPFNAETLVIRSRKSSAMAKPETALCAGDVHLRTFVERMRLAQGGTLPRNSVTVDEVVVAVLDATVDRLSAAQANLLRKVAVLCRIIDQAKVGIAEVSIDAIRGTYIPSAACELDAIIQHTGDATESILEACEALDNLNAALSPDHAAVAQGVTTAIYEACSFQDITGQRITKVVKALHDIEVKVKNLSITYALSVLSEVHVPALQAHVPIGEVAFLNGPALPAAAIDQSDTDKLMADF